MKDEWKKYRRPGTSEMRPWQPGDDMKGVSVSEADLKNGSPKAGDMIARNPKNPSDMWLVAAKYFRDNMEPVPGDDVPPTGYPEQDPEYPGQEVCGRRVTFGAAIEELKAGKRVTRAGWNGIGMYLWLMPEAVVKADWCREPHLKRLAEANGGAIRCLGSIRMYTVDRYGRRAVLTGWLASQSDMLAEDWEILPV